MKLQISHAISRVELQIQRLKGQIDQYATRDKELFEKLVLAYERHDNVRVRILSNELAEIRRQRTLLTDAKLALEDLDFKLRTAYEFGNIGSTASPVADNLLNVKSIISKVLPDVGNELDQVGVKLNNLTTETTQRKESVFRFTSGNEEARKILEEAAIIAGRQKMMRFPDVPADESSTGEQPEVRKENEQSR